MMERSFAGPVVKAMPWAYCVLGLISQFGQPVDAAQKRGDGEPKVYTSAAGGFQLKVPGEPKETAIEVDSADGLVTGHFVQAIDPRTRMIYMAGYVDSRRPNQTSDQLLDEFVAGAIEGGKWEVLSEGRIELDGKPGRSLQFKLSAPGVAPARGSFRAYVDKQRAYQIYVLAPEPNWDSGAARAFLNSFKFVPVGAVEKPALAAPAPKPRPSTPASLAEAEPAPAERNAPAQAESKSEPSSHGSEMRAPAPGTNEPVRPTDASPPAKEARPAESEPPAAAKPAGSLTLAAGLTPIPPQDQFGFFGEPHLDLAPDGGKLIGLRVGFVEAFGGKMIGCVQPVYQVGEELVDGAKVGGDAPLTKSVIAPPGYLVGAIHFRQGLILNGFQLVFFQDEADHLDTGDFIKSEWLGDRGGGRPGTVTAAGRVVVGLQIRSGGEVNALGLVAKEPQDGRSPDTDAP